MDVVLDSSILVADLRMAGGAFRIFFEGLPRIGAVCHIPEIVLEEHRAFFKRKLVETQQRMKAASDVWQKLTLQSVRIPITDDKIMRQLEEFSRHIADTLKLQEVDVLPYPEISHKELVARAVERRKPFNSEGSGYRDALIWQSVVSMKKPKPTATVFVSANAKDFGESPNIHQDLKDLHPSPDSLELFNSLEAFNLAKVLPQLEHLEAILRQIEAGTFKAFSLQKWVAEDIKELLNEFDAGYDLVGLQQGHGSARVSKILEMPHATVDDVRRLPSGALIVSANADIKAEVTVSADGDDCERYDDVRDFMGTNLGGYMWTDIERNANVGFTLTLEADSFSVDSAELDDFDGEVSFEVNPHPRRQA